MMNDTENVMLRASELTSAVGLAAKAIPVTAFGRDEAAQKAWIDNVRIGKEDFLNMASEVDWDKVFDRISSMTSQKRDKLIRKKLDQIRNATGELKQAIMFQENNLLKKENEMLKKAKAKTSAMTKPMTSDAIEKSSPLPWKGQKDKRRIEEVLESCLQYIVISKGISDEKQIPRERARLVLSLIQLPEKTEINRTFMSWRKTQPKPEEAWPSAELLGKWMKDSLTNPTTATQLMEAFTKLKQLQPGLTGFHSYASKFKEEYARLAEAKVVLSDFEAKRLFVQGMHPTVLEYLKKETKTSIIEDPTVTFTTFLEELLETSVTEMQGLSQTDDQEKDNKRIRLIISEEMKKRKFGNKPNGIRKKVIGDKRKGKHLKKVRAAKFEKPKKPWENKNGTDFEVPKDWKDKMCGTCGLLYHKSVDCWQSDPYKGAKTRPSSFKPMDRSALDKLKTERMDKYKKAA
jgi:hypothetical protein